MPVGTGGQAAPAPPAGDVQASPARRRYGNGADIDAVRLRPVPALPPLADGRSPTVLVGRGSDRHLRNPPPGPARTSRFGTHSRPVGRSLPPGDPLVERRVGPPGATAQAGAGAPPGTGRKISPRGRPLAPIVCEYAMPPGTGVSPSPTFLSAAAGLAPLWRVGRRARLSSKTDCTARHCARPAPPYARPMYFLDFAEISSPADHARQRSSAVGRRSPVPDTRSPPLSQDLRSGPCGALARVRPHRTTLGARPAPPYTRPMHFSDSADI